MVDSIAKTLGAGSGIDISALVSSLVDNQFALKTKRLTERSDTITAQLSAVSQLKSGITGFSTALSTLVKSGSLQTQPTSANTNVVRASALPGATLSGLSTSVEVRALAAAQVSNTVTPLPAGTAIGTGTIQIDIGSYATGSFVSGGTTIPPITIAAGEDSLATIATRINAAKTGVTASVLSDSTGQRLVLKGESGEAKAFTLSVTEDSGAPGLSRIAVGSGATGTTSPTAAADARVAVDGVEVRRSTNAISDLVPGVRLELQTVSATPVAIGSTPATENLRQAVNDVVSTYNELYAVLKTATDPVTGALRSDPGARDMMTRLGRLALTDLTGGDSSAPKTLAEVGVATARDGTWSVNATRLNDALTRFPAAVEKMFADGFGASGRGLAGALQSLSTTVTSRTFGLGASEARYNLAKANLSDEQLKATEQAETTRTRLTQQFASMDSRVAAYRSTQSFLTQQIDAWNSN